MPHIKEWLTERLQNYPQVDSATYVPYIIGDNETECESNVEDFCDVLRDILGEFLSEAELEELVNEAKLHFGNAADTNQVADTSTTKTAEDSAAALLACSFATLVTATDSSKPNGKKQNDVGKASKDKLLGELDEKEIAMREEIAQRYGVLTDTEPEDEGSSSDAESQGASAAKPKTDGTAAAVLPRAVDVQKRKENALKRKDELNKRKNDSKSNEAARAQAKASADAKPAASASKAKPVNRK